MTKQLFGRVVLAVQLALVLLLSPAMAAQQQGDSAYEWLNGKWRGPAPGGGIILIDIKANAAGEITGNGRMVSVSRSTYEPQVSGKVDGDKVTLVLSNPRSGNDAHFELTRGGDRLSGKRKSEAIVFEKTQ
jgi:hypothetical protein